MLPEFNPTQRHHTADHLTGESPLSPDGQINISSFLEKSSIVREGGVSALECLVCDENLLARIDKMPVKYAVYKEFHCLSWPLNQVITLCSNRYSVILRRTMGVKKNQMS